MIMVILHVNVCDMPFMCVLVFPRVLTCLYEGVTISLCGSPKGVLLNGFSLCQCRVSRLDLTLTDSSYWSYPSLPQGSRL